MTLSRRSVAEALAAFALVFAGAGAIVTDAERGGALGHVGVALTFGLIIMVMVYAIGHLSGAHLNPAVTAAFTLTRHFPVRDAIAYVVAQLAGAAAAAFALLALWTDRPAALGATVPSVPHASALVYEILLTAFLMFVIMAVAGEWTAFWVYVVGPLAGAALGAFAYQLVRGEAPPVSPPTTPRDAA